MVEIARRAGLDTVLSQSFPFKIPGVLRGALAVLLTQCVRRRVLPRRRRAGASIA